MTDHTMTATSSTSDRLEDYALIGDGATAGLVSRHGSIDWLCLPRFDAPSVFTALLGSARHGRWLLAPSTEPSAVQRHYRDATLVVETHFEVDTGRVRLIDFMVPGERFPRVVRIVRGLGGRVSMRFELSLRFDYGRTVPWVQRADGSLRAVAGPSAVVIALPIATHGRGFRTLGTFDAAAGSAYAFVMQWYPSHVEPPPPADPDTDLAKTTAWWRDWSGARRRTLHGTVLRSALTLKALTHAPTGGLVAAPTTSLPEKAGGVRNWDYRFCWLRDAGFALQALLRLGFMEEADAWRQWLVRAVAGKPSQCQVVYGVAGERRIEEVELPWLPGYGHARPVRVGNAATGQFQLDIYGYVLDALQVARDEGLEPKERAWSLQRALVEHVARVWHRADRGIWEMRGPARQFVHSKVMAWVALDRGIRAIERQGLRGPLGHWRDTRDRIHADVCASGFSTRRQAFVQSYGGDHLDAALLMMPLVGFIPADDPRMISTIRALEQHLVCDGFVHRYSAGRDVDGLPEGESSFLPCTFWMAAALAAAGRAADAQRYFDRACGVVNDVGLLAEEYDHQAGRMMGNFPQALSHMALIDAALALDPHASPSTRPSSQ